LYSCLGVELLNRGLVLSGSGRTLQFDGWLAQTIPAVVSRAENFACSYSRV